jgi:hypothetical protein
MKFAIFGFIFLVSIAATCALYGWLESSVNMIEGLRQFFRPGAGTIVFSPILLLFIVLGLGVFVGGSLLTVIAAATLGGVILRYRALTISQSFARFFVVVAIISQFVFILFAIEENTRFYSIVHAFIPTVISRRSWPGPMLLSIYPWLHSSFANKQANQHRLLFHDVWCPSRS